MVNATDCRSVSWGFDSLPRLSPMVHILSSRPSRRWVPRGPPREDPFSDIHLIGATSRSDTHSSVRVPRWVPGSKSAAREASLASLEARSPEVTEVRVRTFLSWLPSAAARLGPRFLDPDRDTPSSFAKAFPIDDSCLQNPSSEWMQASPGVLSESPSGCSSASSRLPQRKPGASVFTLLSGYALCARPPFATEPNDPRILQAAPCLDSSEQPATDWRGNHVASTRRRGGPGIETSVLHENASGFRVTSRQGMGSQACGIGSAS